MNFITYRVSVLSKLNGIDKDYLNDCLTIDEAIRFGKEEIKNFQLSGHVAIGTDIDFTIRSSLGVKYDSTGNRISGHKRTESEGRNMIDIQELLKDKARLDWLADPANLIGDVTLPAKYVKNNIHSMRDAIDEAMKMAMQNNGAEL